MAKYLLIFSNIRNDYGAVDSNAPIKGVDGYPVFFSNEKGQQCPLTAKYAAMFLAAGLQIPKDKSEFHKLIPAVSAALRGTTCIQYSTKALYPQTPEGYNDNLLLMKGWKHIHTAQKWVESVHIDLNLSKLDEIKFGKTPEGQYYHVHLEGNIGVPDKTLNEKGLEILTEYEKAALAANMLRKCIEEGGRTFRHSWEFAGIKGDDGKGIGIPKINVNSAMYIIVEKKEKGWGTVSIPQYSQDGSTPRLAKNGVQIRKAGWGLINGELKILWGGQTSYAGKKLPYVGSKQTFISSK